MFIRWKIVSIKFIYSSGKVDIIVRECFKWRILKLKVNGKNKYLKYYKNKQFCKDKKIANNKSDCRGILLSIYALFYDICNLKIDFYYSSAAIYGSG